MTTPCYYCEESRATACRVCIHNYDAACALLEVMLCE